MLLHQSNMRAKKTIRETIRIWTEITIAVISLSSLVAVNIGLRIITY